MENLTTPKFMAELAEWLFSAIIDSLESEGCTDLVELFILYSWAIYHMDSKISDIESGMLVKMLEALEQPDSFSP